MANNLKKYNDYDLKSYSKIAKGKIPKNYDSSKGSGYIDPDYQDTKDYAKKLDKEYSDRHHKENNMEAKKMIRSK